MAVLPVESQCGFDFGLRIEDDTIIDNQIARLRPWLARWLVVAVLPVQCGAARRPRHSYSVTELKKAEPLLNNYVTPLFFNVTHFPAIHVLHTHAMYGAICFDF